MWTDGEIFSKDYYRLENYLPIREYSYYDYRSYKRKTIKNKVNFMSEKDKKTLYNYKKHKETEYHRVILDYAGKVKEKQSKKSAEKRSRSDTLTKERIWKDLGRLPKIEPRKYLPKYFVVDKGNESGFCTFCKGTKMPDVIKHNRMIKCPTCGRDVKTVRRDVKQNTIWDDEWVVYPDLPTMTLRYVYCERVISNLYNSATRSYEAVQMKEYAEELARLVIPSDLKTKDGITHYEKQKKYGKYDFWPGHRDYFSEHSSFSYYMENRKCCANAVPYKDMAPFFQKFYPYIPKGSMTEKGWYWQSVAEDLINGSGLAYEQALKAGYINLTMQIGNEYCSSPRTMDDIIRIPDKKTRNLLGYNPTFKDTYFARECLDNGIEYKSPVADKILETFGHMPYHHAKFICSSKTIAKCNYVKMNMKEWAKTGTISKEESFLHEWYEYLETCQKLHYDVTEKHVLFPKPFRKREAEINEEYRKVLEQERFKRERAEARRKRREAKRREKKFSKTIAELKLAMAGSKVIQEMLKGTNGLIVKVPETPDELFQEHVALDNCLDRYLDKMASGKTLIFFIRRMNKEDKAYFAMEYTNGEVIQIRGKLNCDPPPEVKKFGIKIGKALQQIPEIEKIQATA